jgi:hypothetical protein
MSPAALAELEPSGLRLLPPRPAVQRSCPTCLANLFVEPHDPVCGEELVRRLGGSPGVQRAEEALARATARAHAAWVARGCP